MKSAKTLDMTRGSIMKLILLFALPMCIGNVLQQLYNTIDTLVVGNFCGSIALAAVGTSAQPVELLLCIFVGIGTGVSILVSQYTGRGDAKGINELVSTATAFLYICSIPLSILGVFIVPPVLKFMQVPADTWDYAVSYTRIIFLGTLGNMGYNMNAGILRGLGDSKASLLFLFISCLVNVVLDLLFVAGLGMDVNGVAVATIIAMFSSWLLSIVYIKKKYPELDFHVIPHTVNQRMLVSIIRIGLPLGLNNSIYTVGHIAMQSLINAQGSAFMAACSVASKLTGIANVAINALSAAATTFAGQNIGAKQYNRLKTGSLRIPFFSGLITCIGGILVTIFGRQLLGIFTSDPAVLKMAMLYLYIVMPFTWPYAIFNSIIYFVNGLGEVKYPTIVNILTLWAVRIPCAYLIAHFINGQYVTAALPISFFFGMTAMLLYFFSKRWKEILRLAAEQEIKATDAPSM